MLTVGSLITVLEPTGEPVTGSLPITWNFVKKKLNFGYPSQIKKIHSGKPHCGKPVEIPN